MAYRAGSACRRSSSGDLIFHGKCQLVLRFCVNFASALGFGEYSFALASATSSITNKFDVCSQFLTIFAESLCIK